ncbi:hypothetical protein MSAN_00205200 [Mycena sanguinolenta]|uniref:Uncharacterized protein n=1 Tax=Mycena sanguinolenta TaxID=230812 RepID=A0A8H7DLF5_9AGAR|nr:hypothetical protein MSAN_00205200 [Mycena sanguinolenta]
MHLSKSELGALAVFCSYFSIIGGLFLLIFRNLPRSASWGSKAYVFVALTVASFAHTWFYMFSFMAWSFTNYEQSKSTPSTGILIERMSKWLLDTSLFEQAWASVCFGKVNWWWSQQLCLYTVGAWTIFLATTGRRHQVKIVWAYMVLGQLVAISVASNLFYLALVLAGPPRPSTRPSNQWAPLSLWVPVLVSLATVARSPFTDEHTFLPNLLLMHLLIVVPLLVSDSLFNSPQKSLLSMRTSTLNILVFVVAFALHARATMNVLGDQELSVSEFAASAWRILHSHPAQSSIGWDVIWTSISFVVWGILEARTAVYVLLATPLVSVGVLAPHALRPRDEEFQEKKGV